MDSNEKKSKRPRIGEMRTNLPEASSTDSQTSRHEDLAASGAPERSYNTGDYQSYQRPRNTYSQPRQGGYQPRQGGYQPRYNQGGYNQGGYQPRYNQPRPQSAPTEGSEQTEGATDATNTQQHESYQPRYNRPQGGYQPRQNGYNQGGYNPQRRNTGGYNNNRPQSGYNPQGGYNNNRPQGAYNNNRPQGGYNNNRPQGGYNNNRPQGGYNNNRPQGGYNNNRPQGGYNNNRPQGGYNNNRPGGYNNRPGGMQRQPNKQRQNQYGMPQGGKSFTPRPKRIEYETPIPAPDEQIRLNKFMANAGICSRREADEFIQKGLVKVNGETVTELGTKITHSDTVEYNGKVVTLESKCYILLNRPKDCVTTSDDPNGRTTVLDLVKGACEERIYPVGRLDRNTTGVLLLTNDGDLASKLTHPKYVKKKIYHVWCDKDITEDDMQRIADGIELDDGPIHADAISYATETDRNQAGIEIHSGRNRIVRRIFESLGYHVTKLDRVYFAGLTKKNLPRGRWRYLTQDEVNYLKMGSFE